ncbi:hypothetical protein ETAA8_30820 [Anatilimnocola aggregata]|uniref:ASCH domain-containing protein n=1 Tax=Anatilimnocola aggregata TaxID=2528021 RepID=A0A517YCN5_9BACT|nr:ASCH domain-containing protein [Anatilimnocola aggregata]QDU27990.1 hypothetical protein ETAA8_30820 [Anatilimnocola aggregata]
MLLKQVTLDAIARGEVTLAFRRWQRPTVKAGGRLRTAIGELAIQAVDVIQERELTPAAVRQAGYHSLDDLLAELGKRPGTLYRIQFRLAGPDTRIALREQETLAADELAELTQRLARLDAASKIGPWTERVLRLIAAHPELKAGDLAAKAKLDKEWLKLNVRKLKNLGLTESLNPGYRLSPRGEALLAFLGDK